ncbi:hypothetical protein BpHYR1_049496 [Brachionus plicatilis]|uniref:Uncharacterized protein n=1 Tax=Brachionus plicatilis TaxID=10195 RepID=A0A3M7S8P9_BRAPC|nr:hypothetical protein BpHYR1_049496 [Brachionus plicatilis]
MLSTVQIGGIGGITGGFGLFGNEIFQLSKGFAIGPQPNPTEHNSISFSVVVLIIFNTDENIMIDNRIYFELKLKKKHFINTKNHHQYYPIFCLLNRSSFEETNYLIQILLLPNILFSILSDYKDWLLSNLTFETLAWINVSNYMYLFFIVLTFLKTIVGIKRDNSKIRSNFNKSGRPVLVHSFANALYSHCMLSSFTELIHGYQEQVELLFWENILEKAESNALRHYVFKHVLNSPYSWRMRNFLESGFGGLSGSTGGLGTSGKVIFQAIIGFLIFEHPRAKEHISSDESSAEFFIYLVCFNCHIANNIISQVQFFAHKRSYVMNVPEIPKLNKTIDLFRILSSFSIWYVLLCFIKNLNTILKMH